MFKSEVLFCFIRCLGFYYVLSGGRRGRSQPWGNNKTKMQTKGLLKKMYCVQKNNTAVTKRKTQKHKKKNKFSRIETIEKEKTRYFSILFIMFFYCCVRNYFVSNKKKRKDKRIIIKKVQIQ